MTDQELQSLRNMGNEAEAAADEIERLRVALADVPEAGFGNIRAALAEPVAWQMPGTDSIITAATKTYRGVIADGYTVPLVNASTAAQHPAQAGLTALERNAATKDSARLQFLEDQTMEGHAPNLVFDDDGNWSVSYTGMQPIPRGGGRGFDETVTIACIVEPGEWRPSIREAIDAAIAAAEAGNVGAV